MAFIGEIQLFAFGYAPPSWQLCDGSLLQIRQFSPLYALIGSAYGGNGVDNFRVPNLIGRATCQAGAGLGTTPRNLGDTFGTAQVVLDSTTAPPHTHGLTFYAITKDSVLHNVPETGDSLASPSASVFVNATADVDMKNAISTQGASAPHENRQPYLGMAFYIKAAIGTDGTYPVFP